MFSNRPTVRSKTRRKKRKPYNFVATCGAGLENMVKEEILSFGGDEPVTTPGAVRWQATGLASAYRACLWSRFSSKILLEMAQFEAATPEVLYDEVGKIDWGKHFSGNTTFAVHCTLVNAELTHSHYASLKVKDAVVDQFRDRTGERPDVDVRKPGIRINLHVEETAATLALDLSGDSLHRRGYRTGTGEAPLKETLAAVIAHLSGVRADMSADLCLLDPMCGSGTLLIEAALIIGDSAPGLLRDNFGFMYWHGHNVKMWEKLVAEALDREDELTENPWPSLIGYDADPKVVAVARKNIINAGLSDRITIKQRQLNHLQPPAAKGILLSNPPYGERLAEKEAVKYLYRALGRIFRHNFSGWQLGLFTANPDLADMLGVSWLERHRLYNGPIKCRLFTAVSPGGTEPDPHVWNVGETDSALPAEDFSNRLIKNCQTLLPWAEKNKITCFRIYDADLPEFNIAVDIYEQWVHVREYAPPATVAPEEAEERFSQALQVIRHLLAVPHSNLFVKTGRKQERKEQRSREGEQQSSGQAKLYEVHERDCRFLVNFTDYQDTGLALDGRKIREMLAELADGRTFLNLFGGIGAETVCAAMGGAVSTKTVDRSEKNLIQAQANLCVNGLGGSLHQFKEADPVQWLRSCREYYSVIFIAPSFDIQRDHVELLRLAMQRLTQDGVLVLLTGSNTFTLDAALTEEFDVKDITNQIVPEDFKGGENTRACWRFRHRSEEE